MALSRFATDKARRELPGPSKPRPESRTGIPPKPASKPAKGRMTDVTVKLPDALVAKLDRLVKRESGRLGRVGRSTVLRWLLDSYQE